MWYFGKASVLEQWFQLSYKWEYKLSPAMCVYHDLFYKSLLKPYVREGVYSFEHKDFLLNPKILESSLFTKAFSFSFPKIRLQNWSLFFKHSKLILASGPSHLFFPLLWFHQNQCFHSFISTSSPTQTKNIYPPTSCLVTLFSIYFVDHLNSYKVVSTCYFNNY